eukprot:4896277-Ditylum_brightwellii.AAC.1
MNPPTHSVLFDTFVADLERKIGRDVRPDIDPDYRVMHLILENVNKDLSDCGTKEEKGFEHVVIPLLGEFNGKRCKRWHLILVSAETASGFKSWVWAADQEVDKERDLHKKNKQGSHK